MEVEYISVYKDDDGDWGWTAYDADHKSLESATGWKDQAPLVAHLQEQFPNVEIRIEVYEEIGTTQELD